MLLIPHKLSRKSTIRVIQHIRMVSYVLQCTPLRYKHDISTTQIEPINKCFSDFANKEKTEAASPRMAHLI